MAPAFRQKAYYDILGVERAADLDTIKKSYKKAALTHHPDKGGEHECFQLVSEAFNVLSDAAKRADYDRLLRAKRSNDGVGGVRRTSSTKPPSKPDMARQQSNPNDELRRPSFVEIPNNLNILSIKELKEILVKLGMRHDDCVEKSDLITRITNATTRKRDEASSSSSKARDYQRYATTSAPPPAPSGPPPSSKEIAIKIISAGNQEVGKSCLIKRYCEGRFIKKYISTIGIDYGVKRMQVKGYSVAVNFFDLSGCEDFRSIRSEFYADAQGCLLVYDINNRDSFAALPSWEAEMRSHGLDFSRLKVVLCANRADLKSREVSFDEAKKFASKRGYELFETSSSTGDNVAAAFEWLFHAVVNRVVEDRRRLGLPTDIS